MKSEKAAKMRSLANGTAQRTKRRESICTCAKLQKKARKAVRNIELDMRELLNVDEVSSWSAHIRFVPGADKLCSGTVDSVHELARDHCRRLNFPCCILSHVLTLLPCCYFIVMLPSPYS